MNVAVDGDLEALYGRRPRVLVVDDQPANVQALYRVFAADHQVFMATSGAQALGVCESQQPDLVLLDVEMPGMDGYQVCGRLKGEAALRDIPVIFVTAHEDEVAEARALDAGAVDFISKPINPRIVRLRVRTHLILKHQSDLLRQWAYVDGLTVVSNRRLFDDRLAMEWARAVRERSSLSVVLIDVDHFKRYNDHYGHLAGDDCLRRVAAALKTGLRRPADLLARYGGEEFVCLLPDTDSAGAQALARQLGQQVRKLGIEHVASDAAPVVTVSLGACTQPSGVVGSTSALLREADAQLYAAKSGGRDRVSASVLSAP